MKKLILLSAFFFFSSHAMQAPLYPVAHARNKLAKEGNVYDPEPSWNAPLTRELVLNAYWRALENRSQEEKDAALARINLPNELYNLERYHYAAAAFIGADLNKPKHSILFEIAARQDYELCRILLNHGANPNHSSVPLYNANTLALATLFVQNGANINAYDPYIHTYLHMILGSPSCEPLLVRFCVKHGMNPLDKNSNGMTSLHMLALSMHSFGQMKEKMEYLFEAIDDPGKTRELIDTPYQGKTIFELFCQTMSRGETKQYEWLCDKLRDLLDGTEKKKLA